MLKESGNHFMFGTCYKIIPSFRYAFCFLIKHKKVFISDLLDGRFEIYFLLFIQRMDFKRKS